MELSVRVLRHPRLHVALRAPRDQQIVVDGEEACVVSHISAANAGGVPIEANVANYFRLQDDKIVYMANFHDSVPFGPFVNQKL